MGPKSETEMAEMLESAGFNPASIREIIDDAKLPDFLIYKVRGEDTIEDACQKAVAQANLNGKAVVFQFDGNAMIAEPNESWRSMAANYRISHPALSTFVREWMDEALADGEIDPTAIRAIANQADKLLQQYSDPAALRRIAETAKRLGKSFDHFEKAIEVAIQAMEF